VGIDRIARAPWREPQAVVMQHRKAIDHVTRKPQLPGVEGDFAIGGPIAGHPRAGCEWLRQELCGKAVGGADARGGRDFTAPLAHEPADVGAFGLHARATAPRAAAQGKRDTSSTMSMRAKRP